MEYTLEHTFYTTDLCWNKLWNILWNTHLNGPLSPVYDHMLAGNQQHSEIRGPLNKERELGT